MRRPVLLVIAPVVLGNLDLQSRVLGLRLLFGQQIDGRFVGFDFGFGHARNLKTWMPGNKLTPGPVEGPDPVGRARQKWASSPA